MGCTQSTNMDPEAHSRKSTVQIGMSDALPLTRPGALSFAVFLSGNQEIERQLKKDKAEAKKQVNILLLGAGESGKVSG